MDPQRINDCSFFPVNRIFETVLLLQKQYADLDPKDLLNPNNLLK